MSVKQDSVKNWAYSKSADLAASLDYIGGHSEKRHGELNFDPSRSVAGLTLSERWWYAADMVIRFDKKMKMFGGASKVQELLDKRSAILNDLALNDPEDDEKEKKLKSALARIEERFDGSGITADRFERYLRLKEKVENEPRTVAAQAPNMNLAVLTALRHIVAGQQSVTLTPKQMQGTDDLPPPLTTGQKEAFNE